MEHSDLFCFVLIFSIIHLIAVRGQFAGDPYGSGSYYPGYQNNYRNSGAGDNTGAYRAEAALEASRSFSRRSPPETYSFDDPLKGRRIVCIYNSMNFYKNKFTPKQIDPSLCSHVNYEFAILDERTYEMNYSEPILDDAKRFYGEAVGLKERNPSLKVMLSIGGWKDSTKKYSDLVASPEKVENFVKKCIPYLKSYGFDGLDVAWEYPNCWQGALGISPHDKENFVTFLQRLRQELDTEGMTLSVSVGAIKREIEKAYDAPAIAEVVHHINVMTYDMHGPWERTTGHHLQFDKKSGDSDPNLNMKSVMEIWSNMGVPKTKLNAGIATYAKTFTLVDPNSYEIGAPTKGPGHPGEFSKQGGFLFYNEICQYLNAGNWTEEEDKAHGFYAHSGDQWACYDPPMMVVRKVKWIAENGYGGILVKDVSGDDFEGKCFSMEFPLIRMMRMEFIHKMKRIH